MTPESQRSVLCGHVINNGSTHFYCLYLEAHPIHHPGMNGFQEFENLGHPFVPRPPSTHFLALPMHRCRGDSGDISAQAERVSERFKAVPGPIWKPGDRATWTFTTKTGYGYVIRTPVIVRAVGRQRVLVEGRRAGAPAFRWVMPENLRPRNVPCSKLGEPSEEL